MRRLQHLLTILLLPLLLSCGCGKQGGASGYRIEGLVLNKTSLEMVEGDVVELKAYPKPSVANALTLSWSSSDPAVATVAGGVVTAVAVGQAMISVAYQTAKAEIPVTVTAKQPAPVAEFARSVMYDQKIGSLNKPAEVELNGMAAWQEGGLLVNKTGGIVKLNRFYALAERAVRYRIVPTGDAVCLFRSSEGDFQARVDVPGKKISIMTTPVTTAEAAFLAADKEYEVEIQHIYQKQILRVKDVASGTVAEVVAVNDGEGGCGQGKVNNGFYVGPGWDHYCFGLVSGTSMLVSRITVESLKDKVRLLIIGDSITQPEAYYPTADFPQAYTQLLIERLGGRAMSSGRGGGTINTLLEYVPHELPYIQADYVMVTIGANGGNTEANLTQLVKMIQDCGSIPILNNMPCNESGTQNNAEFGGNPLIRQVRAKLGLKGAELDKATSLAGDGMAVDKSKMYWEDYTGYPAPMTGWQIYHHPNPNGGQAMFRQIVKDLPEIFE